jgi:hypothetical protein
MRQQKLVNFLGSYHIISTGLLLIDKVVLGEPVSTLNIMLIKMGQNL